MRAIIKAAEWTLGPETAEGAPKEPMYEAECLTCEEQSGATDGDLLPAEVWALKHTGLNPTHRTYRAIITSFWRVSPTEGNPYSELEAK
ncbi:hypothetical protein GQF42_16130 [Streptomyces broussonetiae]|uniref:DUF7848 domain-containing protein n=1 Tax=Streptomyces broussonetiae TaxID=2686304 RepID=A0A6I6N839_9ACTN|nr:hypothetical protein [Streptomyces broussonetiae]QHA04617.1 hypothetical protein GQF42_16130 [Streptomyces broussonetiae]